MNDPPKKAAGKGDFEPQLREMSQSLPPLESILCTDELNRRPSRPPDYETENRALVSLAQALADAPGTILQTLADTILKVFQCDSAGVSLVTEDEKRFHWPAIAGIWKPHIGGGTPRDFGPCGDVLDRNCPLLFTHFERRYTYFLPVTPPVEECLLVPFYVEGTAVGTIWAITHDDRPGARKFDNEDLRMLVSLGTFASAAYQAVEQQHALSEQAQARQEAQQDIREMNEALLVSSVHQHELTEEAQEAEAALRESQQRYRRIAQDQRLLAAELAHRVKNTLTTVQAIASQTRRFAATPEEFDIKFGARINMLAKAHGLLTKTSWEGASITDIVHTALRPHVSAFEDVVSMDGPDVILPARQVLAVIMLIHELSINAVKYGSLSTSEGRLIVTWREQDGRIALSWREQGGPPVAPPTRKGFGSTLIGRIVSFELQGDAVIDYPRDGVTCDIEFPVDRAANVEAQPDTGT